MIHQTVPRRALAAMGIAVVACGAVVVAFGVGKASGMLDPLVARRGVGAMLGLMLMAVGNFVPKLRLFQPATGAAHSDAIDRFAGWTFVLCGLAFAAVFLVAPADKVFIVPPLIVLAGLVAVLARWLMWRGRQPGRLPDLTSGRLALAMMLVSIVWVCAIFLADAVWGDDVAHWMALLLPMVVVASAIRFRRVPFTA